MPPTIPLAEWCMLCRGDAVLDTLGPSEVVDAECNLAAADGFKWSPVGEAAAVDAAVADAAIAYCAANCEHEFAKYAGRRTRPSSRPACAGNGEAERAGSSYSVDTLALEPSARCDAV
jgi:hypothetical protein